MDALSLLVCLGAAYVDLDNVDGFKLGDFVVCSVQETHVFYTDGMSGDAPIDRKVFRAAPQENPNQDRSPPNDAVLWLGEIKD